MHERNTQNKNTENASLIAYYVFRLLIPGFVSFGLAGFGALNFVNPDSNNNFFFSRPGGILEVLAGAAVWTAAICFDRKSTRRARERRNNLRRG